MENVKNKSKLQAEQECCPSQLKRLLDQEEDINRVLDESGNTALHLSALETARLACAQLLIERGADPDVKNKEGETPLHVACRSRNDHFVRLLVSEKATFNIDTKDDTGLTALMICVIKKDESILDILIEAGANLNEVSENFDGYTALQLAIFFIYPCSNSLQNLITKSDINFKDNQGMTAFQLAIQFKRVDHAYLLLENSSQVNVYETDNFGNTIFHIVIHQKRTAYLEKIIGNISDLVHNKNKLKMTPLHCAVRTKFQEGVELILMNDIKEIPDNCPIRALFTSIVERDELSLNTILFNGVAIDPVDSCGRGPLHWAVMVGFPSGVDMLLSKGADVNRQDKFGISALHFAALIDNEGIVTKLLSNGADVNMKDGDGRTPLHFASLSNKYYIYSEKPAFLRHFCVPPYSNTSTIVILMRAGCLLDLQDCDGNTPLNLALSCEDGFAVHALLIWGAKTDIANTSGDSQSTLSDRFNDGRLIYIQSFLYYHIVKLKQAKLQTYNGNHFSELKSIILNCQEDLKPLFEQCDKEVNEMARLKIGNFYLHDVFTEKKHSIIFDNELRSLVFSTSTEENFPSYGNMLQATFLKSELRYQRINEAVLLPLSAETKSGDVAHIPEEVKRMIFSLLPDEDLVSFIKAV